jgi:hypothetical protein
MLTRLMTEPVWLPPDESLLKLSGRRLCLVTPSGVIVHCQISLALRKVGGLKYAVQITNGKAFYLTAEAVSMIKPMPSDQQNLILSFAE